MRRRRFRTGAKWACTATAFLAVGLAALSRFYAIARVKDIGEDATRLTIEARHGLFCAKHFTPARSLVPPSATRWTFARSPGWDWGFSRSAATGGILDDWRGGLLLVRVKDQWAVGTSVVYPAVLACIPAVLLWSAERRRLLPHRCGKCGYDRRGLTADAKCPECGVPASPRATFS
jgi:hypothetical protein